jgi:hypothetical protein
LGLPALFPPQSVRLQTETVCGMLRFAVRLTPFSRAASAVFCTEVDEIRDMILNELRLCIQHALGLEEWLWDDWVVVGMIFDETALTRFRRMAAPPHNFEAIIMGKGIGNGIGTELVSDPVEAIVCSKII